MSFLIIKKTAWLNPGMNLNVETRYIASLQPFWFSNQPVSYIKSATPKKRAVRPVPQEIYIYIKEC